MSVRENWERIGEELDKIPGASPRVLGVTKGQPLEKVREAVAAGVTLLGNNYAQEGEALMGALTEFSGEWHFIGHIQSRKVKYLSAYHCIESLDRLSVAQDLERRLAAEDRSLSCLVEINSGEEDQKSGVRVNDLEAFLESLASLSHLKVTGLMTMPPFLEPVEERRPYFRRARELFDQLKDRHRLSCLSMGTSGDYLIAAEEGATLVRLGTTLFGPRDYPRR